MITRFWAFSTATGTISNLNPTVIDGNTGLFGINSGTIKNVYLDRVDVVYTDGYGAAALCGKNSEDGIIEGCAVLGGRIDAANTDESGVAAGICAKNSGKINKCYNMAAVTTNSVGAGIVYYNDSDGTVSNCYNAGEVSGTSTGETIGGICSDNYGKIEYCLNYGEVKNAKTVGGICGLNGQPGEYSAINSCYSDSDACSAEAVGKNDGGEESNVGTKTTVELCARDALYNIGFGGDWENGDIYWQISTRYGDYKYPKLVDVTNGELFITGGIYNFGTSKAPDWKAITVIKDPDGLKAINNDLGGNYVLGANIDLKGEEWTPIGSSGEGFTGTFGGDGKTISNFKSSVSTSGSSAGLFGYNSGTIQDVYVDKFEVKTNGRSPAAGLCAVNKGTIEGCATLGGKADSTLGGMVAGLCASNYGKIDRCYNTTAVTTYGVAAGGVVNANWENGTVSNCYNAGNVSSTEDWSGSIGGICATNDGKIEKCLNYANVKNGDYVGGICAENNIKGTVTSCYSDSSVCRAHPVGSTMYLNALSDVEGKTTEDLCNFVDLNGFDSGIWNSGFYNARPTSSGKPRFGELYMKYTSLIDVGSVEAKTYDVYDFGIGDVHDWQKYTLIENETDLAAINENLDGNYVLANYIKLSGKWTPLGSNDGAFTGRFSGEGHTISSVNVMDGEFAGLFGYNTGVIMNVAVEGSVSGKSCVGGICGANSGIDGKGIISNCTFNGTVTGTENNVGGIAGYNLNGANISNCFTAAEVSGNDEVGGICGYNSTNTTVSYSISVGTVSGSNDLAAAVCGKNDGTLTENYFDKDFCDLVGAKDNNGNAVAAGAAGVDTELLCCGSVPTGFESKWSVGNKVTVDDTKNARKRTIKCTYPIPEKIGEAYSTDVKEYNFKTDGSDDWQAYTEISTPEDFIAITEIKREIDGNYVLATDIDLDGQTISPIGGSDKFSGKFSGDGHTISNFKINSKEESVGLFGWNEGLIMNLAVSGDITGGDTVGGICGINNGTVYGCSFEGSVTGSRIAGGICGHNTDFIIRCYAIGSVEVTEQSVEDERYASGISGSANSEAEIIECYFSGTVTAPYGAVKDAICSECIVADCYYNSDLYTETGSSGTGLTTLEMTSSNALTKMWLDTSTWTKEYNQNVDSNGENGVAYYPSHKGSTHVSSVKYTVDLTFERTGTETLSFLDNFEVKYSGKVVFENGGSVTLDKTNCDLTVLDNNNKAVGSFDALTDKLVAPVVKAGESTYTFTCVPKSTYIVSEFLPDGGLTKRLTIDAAKYTLTADDFEVDIPSLALCEYNGKPWTVTAKIKDDSPLAVYGGCGEITVRYYDYDNTDKEVEPINAGSYLVKLDVSEGENCYAATGITADNKEWYLGITKADYNPPAVNVAYNWETTSEKFVCVDIPTDLERIVKIHDANITADRSIISAARYEDGKVYFTFSANTEQDIGKMAIIECRIDSQNYYPIFATVYVTLNGLANQEAPSADDFDLVLNNNGSDITADIKTDLTGVEYSFDGVMWSTRFSTPAQHDEIIVGYIRYAATSTQNASAPSFKKLRSGHGDLSANHYDREEPTCVDDGRIEYWECIDCKKKFSDAEGLNEVKTVVLAALGHDPAAAVEENREEATCIYDGSYDEVIYCSVCNTELSRETKIIPAKGHTPDEAEEEHRVEATCTEDGSCDEVIYCSVCNVELSRDHKVIKASGHTWSAKYESDKSGHWHKCEVCNTESDVQKHISGGAATTSNAEICTVCGYEIAPKKTSGGSSGGGSRPSTPTETKPAINGTQKSWSDIAADLAKQSGGSAVISLNGETSIPADVIKAIADKKIRVELIIDSAKSWIIDGAKITSVSAADFSTLPGNADKSALRGTVGADLKITGTSVPAELKLNFRKEFAGQFANIYKLIDKKLVFQGCVKVSADGSAVISGANTSGEYVVMVCEFSDLRGDISNDGVLNALDAAAALKEIVGIAKGANPMMGDFNGDGIVNALDASAILKKIVGIAA